MFATQKQHFMCAFNANIRTLVKINPTKIRLRAHAYQFERLRVAPNRIGQFAGGETRVALVAQCVGALNDVRGHCAEQMGESGRVASGERGGRGRGRDW
jgi:hypothetical protein